VNMSFVIMVWDDSDGRSALYQGALECCIPMFDEKPTKGGIKADIEDVEENPVENKNEAYIGGSPPWGIERKESQPPVVESYENDNQAVINN
jgi:hypothetical protein